NIPAAVPPPSHDAGQRYLTGRRLQKPLTRRIERNVSRIAVPYMGSLSGAARETLSEAGYRQRRDSKELVLVDPENKVEFFYLRPRDIAIYVAKGSRDAGLAGRDLFLDAQVGDAAEELMGLGFARSTFRFAAPEGAFTSVKELAGKRIATSYDGLLSDYLKSSDIQPERIVH